MDDFARACGVSRPTLSKFFDDPESVRPATRQRIEAALQSSDYHPNLYARNLNRKRTRSVGIIVPAITDPFYAEMVNRLELRLRDEGYWPVVISSHGMPELEAEAIRTMLSLKVAGAIVAPLGPVSDRHAFEKLGRSIPLVYFDTRLEDETPFVGNDNRQSLATIVDYLCRSGAPPVYLDIPHVNHNSGERVDNYVAAMRRLGFEPVVLESTHGYSWDFERIGFERMGAILDAGGLPGPTLLCANDRLAFGVMAAAYARGLKVGRRSDCDLRVAAHDDHPLSRYTCPALTTMAQDYAAMAGQSVELLLKLLDAAEAEEGDDAGATARVSLPAALIMRDSA